MIQPIRIPIIKRSGYFFRWYYNGWHYWQFYPGALNYKTEGEKYRTRGTRSITASSGTLTESQVKAVRTILNTTEVYLYSDSGWAAVRIETGEAEVKNNRTLGYEVQIKATIGSRMLSVTGFSPVIDIPIIPPSVDQCEITIGTQIWMCKNYDSNYPGSKVYNNEEANRALYGGLYTFDMVRNPGFCPEGWHVPSEAEWQTLIDFAGGWETSGGILKQTGTDYWNSPNTGASDDYGFKARGAGYINTLSVFAGLKEYGYFWTKDEGVIDIYGKCAVMFHNSAEALFDNIPKTMFLPVRLLRNTLAVPFDDWFLPSKDELEQMQIQLHAYGLGGFGGIYVSSSELNATLVHTNSFGTGLGAGYKYTELEIRACRMFTTSTVYALRDIGPAGGYIFIVEDLGGGNYRYFEAEPEQNLNIYPFSNITNVAIGTTGTAIGTGQANTVAIIAQLGHTASAAKVCDDLIVYR